ncbi:putative cytochrome c oxidase subunit [Clavispora lusitaniae]|uniref:Cytochrome c oxidase subunit n=1 Tax=Clavispora lusitaniae TaxID=36911 RepID=A0ACD0WIR8_CLALS|nr:putative cytochrome c oxidase subunit [Clavispora lusitaniae]QFZ33492.1 putative cytochrome c oxidase subunit [Clavispora lusitaniae]QFZ39163.1 putative cytochrome c oxidase subunit [Clavispora lusitaniae]QFZ44845.1 putative cytochrome c oxidase subunit [Clavispora lusitaniae]QFZ50522.1 putative cytochrome c oxidase subunit [Clavispora lusitaniae]
MDTVQGQQKKADKRKTNFWVSSFIQSVSGQGFTELQPKCTPGPRIRLLPVQPLA